MLQAVTDQTKLLFVCSPGNPTSKAIPISDIEQMMESSSFQGIMVVDEAYVDFSSQTSAISLVHKYPNLVVLQTLSKAFGLAGIRCGFAVAHCDIIQLMNNVKAPYNINKMTSEVALNAFTHISELKKNIEVLLDQRELLVQELLKLDFVVKVFHSDSNFLLCRLKAHSYAVYKTMADRGIVVRYRGHELHCNECLRITVGTPEENKALLEALPRIYHELDSKC
jgi:histidinol-phosphate aminotransferase